ncbi:MAG: hypothetical protein KF709_03525 [Gemmatimonadaceae bacterium]|nr:hypothetical protein [Gemmatimonadaceae bacterium]
MQHRHLLPQELDLLVDGDVGFGVAPLRAHLETCDDCRLRLVELEAVTGRLDTLPHFAPRIGFSDRVMAQVQVIEPWHVALANQARALVPQTAPMRVLAAVGAGLAATTISGSALWLAFRADLFAFSYGVGLERGTRGIWAGLVETARELVTGGADTGALLVATGALAATAVGAVLAFRRLAAAARTNRS